jgi:hypothetical protein
MAMMFSARFFVRHLQVWEAGRPRCANVHLGPEDQHLHKQAGYTSAPDPLETLLAISRSTSGGVHIGLLHADLTHKRLVL